MSNTTPLLDPLPHIFPLGTLNLFGGSSGIGKTALIAALACAFRDGTPLFGHQTNPASAIAYIGADRPWATAAYWFTQAGFPDIKHYSLVDDRTVKTVRLRQRNSGAHGQIFAEILDTLKLPPGSIVIADPLALFLGGNLVDYMAVAATCIDLQRICVDRQLCGMGIVHASKQKADPKERYLRLRDRFSGTGALGGFTDTQMYLAAPEEVGADYYLLEITPHQAPAETFRLKKDPATGLFLLDAYERHDGPTPVAPTPPKPRVTLDLTATLAQFPPFPAQLATVDIVSLYADLSRATLFRRLDKLKELGYLWQPKHGVWSRVPPEAEPAGEGPLSTPHPPAQGENH